jgi:hypothetical protein
MFEGSCTCDASPSVALCAGVCLGLGGGEVDVKMKVKVSELVKAFDVIVGDITYDEGAPSAAEGADD